MTGELPDGKAIIRVMEYLADARLPGQFWVYVEYETQQRRYATLLSPERSRELKLFRAYMDHKPVPLPSPDPAAFAG